MAFGLVQAVLQAHGLAAAPGRGPEAEPAHVDQVLLGCDEAPLVVALLKRARVERVRVSPVLADPGWGGAASEDEPAGDWRSVALGLGLTFPRPGHGDPWVLHRERLAAPGRLALCAGGLAACGALGMLALETDALDAAAVLAGGPLSREAPCTLGVELAGELPPGVGGVDLALALLARLRASGEPAEALELGGAGVGALAMTERMSAAWLLAEAGLPALFPSDDVTRAELAAQGRDQDWRRVEAAGEADAGTWRVSLTGLEPLLAPVGDPAGSSPASALVGTPVERVLLGPAATLADLTRFAARLEGRRVREGVECAVVAGSRAVLDRATASGVAQRLTVAGVSVVEGHAAAHAAGSGLGLCFGVPLEAVRTGRARWLVAGVEACAAAALAGAVAPAAAEGPALASEAASAPGADPWLTGAGGPGAMEAAASPARSVAPALPRGPLRGEVLVVLQDGLECAQLLAPGARLEGLRSQLEALAGQLLVGLDADFPQRARERGGGFVVAGEQFACGEPRSAVALCLAESGVRAVLAPSYAAGMARALVHAGVMPLRLTRQAEGAPLERGDELELPGLPDALVPGRPLAARNLTQGVPLSLGHDLAAHEIAVLRAGGLLPFVTDSAAGGERT